MRRSAAAQAALEPSTRTSVTWTAPRRRYSTTSIGRRLAELPRQHGPDRRPRGGSPGLRDRLAVAGETTVSASPCSTSRAAAAGGVQAGRGRAWRSGPWRWIAQRPARRPRPWRRQRSATDARRGQQRRQAGAGRWARHGHPRRVGAVQRAGRPRPAPSRPRVRAPVRLSNQFQQPCALASRSCSGYSTRKRCLSASRFMRVATAKSRPVWSATVQYDQEAAGARRARAGRAAGAGGSAAHLLGRAPCRAASRPALAAACAPRRRCCTCLATRQAGLGGLARHLARERLHLPLVGAREDGGSGELAGMKAAHGKGFGAAGLIAGGKIAPRAGNARALEADDLKGCRPGRSRHHHFRAPMAQIVGAALAQAAPRCRAAPRRRVG